MIGRQVGRLVGVTRLAATGRVVARLAGKAHSFSRPFANTAVGTDIANSVHPPLANYVHGMEASRGSRLIFTSGQLGLTPDGTVSGCAEQQAVQCFANIAGILRSAGMGLEDVVRLNAYVTDRSHLPAYMRARDAAFLDNPPVASTLMVVSGFAKPEYLVEVEAIAALSIEPATDAASTQPLL